MGIVGYTRFPSGEVDIGGVLLGHAHPVRVQSMTNTPTEDVKATVEQCLKAFDAGADYMRISVPDNASLESLKRIRAQLNQSGCKKPLIADIHFRAELAMEAAKIVEKVRINPGNYTPQKARKKTWTRADQQEELEMVRSRLSPLVRICKDYGTAIRVGTNSGSLSPRIINWYGHTPEALAESAMEYLHLFNDLAFRSIIVSLKASNPLTMIASYHLMAGRMLEENLTCPLHTGVTEAGAGESGRMKSALGIIPLLQAGIGDTIRVSLTGEPEEEIPFAKEIAARVKSQTHPEFRLPETPPPPLPGNHKAIVLTSTPAISPDSTRGFRLVELQRPDDLRGAHTLPPEDRVLLIVNLDKGFPLEKLTGLQDSIQAAGTEAGIIARTSIPGGSEDRQIIDLCVKFGSLFLQGKLHGLWINNPGQNRQKALSAKVLRLLQAAGLRFSDTEFIACPTCARTSYDLERVYNMVKDKASGRPGLKIAVMGCVVNGPGEMAGADYGILGAANGSLQVFRRGKAVHKNLDPEAAVNKLLALVNEGDTDR
ncbi:MAG: (E)-4-hydroxy-3-methylbut-2-enyl-diphosphate synthase [Bacteroidales bacterium]